MLAMPAVADEPGLPEVAFAGVTFAGPPEHFPQARLLAPSAVRETRRLLLDEGARLPFKLLTSTDNDLFTGDSGYLVLSLLVTDESALVDTYTLPGGVRFHRQFCDLSLVALILDAATKRVVASFPVTAEAALKLDHTPTNSEVADTYDLAFRTGLATLAERLRTVSLATVRSQVDLTNGVIRLDHGQASGAASGTQVVFLDEQDAQCGKGVITELGLNTATVTLSQGRAGSVAMFRNLKLYSEDTYQVVGVETSSAKARGLFDAGLHPLVAQWFSDYYSAAGHVVLPSRLGGDWAKQGEEAALRIYPLAGDAFTVTMPEPKHAIRLDLSGLASEELVANDIERWLLFKAWTKATVVGAERELEVDEVVKKQETVGLQSFSPREVYLDVIRQALAKLAKSL